MSSSERILRPSVWAIYTIIVFEILFMISPFALYFYSVYGPVLRFFDQWAGTAWLTQFFLPHISETRSHFLNILHGLAWPLILIGTGLFLGGAVPPLLGEIPAPRGGNHGALCVHPPSTVCGARRCGLGHPLVLAPILRAHHLPDHALPLWPPRPVGRRSMPCAVWRELPHLPGTDRAVLAPGVVAEAWPARASLRVERCPTRHRGLRAAPQCKRGRGLHAARLVTLEHHGLLYLRGRCAFARPPERR
jgi:hypothetical protein